MAVPIKLRALVAVLALLVAACGFTAVHAQDTGEAASAYTIGGIAVDVVAHTTDEARTAAYAQAVRKAWPQLWARTTGQPLSAAPGMSDGTLESIVSGIEIQGERFSTTRYIATLGVVFDRARASAFMTATTGAVHSEPMLLLPVQIDGGTRTVYEHKTPWVQAWMRYREAISPIDYVMASGSPGDNILLTGYQTRRADRALWRNILNRFRTVDVLIAEVKLTRLYPGGPIEALFIARHGPDATELGRVGMRTSAANGLDAMLNSGVRAVDAIYAEALRDGRLRSEPDLAVDLAPIVSAAPVFDAPVEDSAVPGIEALVATPDSESWNAIEARLRATPTVTGVGLTSLSLGGSSHIVIRHSDSREMLDYELAQAGLRLAPTANGLLLRAREAGDPVPPRPMPVAPVESAPNAAETSAGPPTAAPPAKSTATPPTPKGNAPTELLPETPR